MSKFKGGVEEAAKMLQSLSSSESKKLLQQIRAKDPKMAELLEDKMISLNELEFLSPSMLVGLLRDLNLEVFGLALRSVDQHIVEKILSQVSTGIRLEIEDGLKGKPRRMSEVEEAQSKVLKILKDKVDKGHIILGSSDDELV